MTRHTRLIVFALIVALQFGGPFYRQVLHGRNPIFKNWVMYRGTGSGLVEVSFFQHRDGLPDTPINRFAALGYDKRSAPDDLFHIAGADGFARIVQQLCTQLGPNVDLRAHAREATDPGWQPLATGREGLCPAHGPDPS